MRIILPFPNSAADIRMSIDLSPITIMAAFDPQTMDWPGSPTFGKVAMPQRI